MCGAPARKGCSRCSPAATSNALEVCTFNRIVTTDPHSLNALRQEYPALGATPYTVLHHTDLLLELIEAGKSAAEARSGRRP